MCMCNCSSFCCSFAVFVVSSRTTFGRGDDTVGNPHGAQVFQFEILELKFLNSSCSSLFSY